MITVSTTRGVPEHRLPELKEAVDAITDPHSLAFNDNWAGAFFQQKWGFSVSEGERILKANKEHEMAKAKPKSDLTAAQVTSAMKWAAANPDKVHGAMTAAKARAKAKKDAPGVKRNAAGTVMSAPKAKPKKKAKAK